MPGATLPGRTTVLPRVELGGPTPRLVVPGKPRYERTRRLGEGGIGEVHGARDNDIERDVAVKRLRPEAMSPAALLRFVEEVRTVGRLEHPNIVPIHDVGVDERGEYYFVMKYVDGETLEDVVDKLAAGDRAYHARYTFERRVQIVHALLDALAFAHERSIIHRDIKPANVMIGPHGEVMLMDWGIAKDLAAATTDLAAEEVCPHPARRGALFQTVAGQLVGTPAYMAPEQARGEPVDARSDLYSLSMLFYELLTLQHPLADKASLAAMLEGVKNEDPPFATSARSPHQPAVPAELAWLVRRGLAKDPAARFQSAGEMIDRLARRAEGQIPVQCHITLVKRVNGEWTRFVDRHPTLMTIGFGLVLLGFLAGIVMTILRLV
ncbi:MAG: serine/threonine protein kinase [Labilithrix sp.]|nr:serine/threonine protein kinase [Labilithrix sp.]MCW5810832.1 serine/threonine protein kinase [Labilithrix sp.]